MEFTPDLYNEVSTNKTIPLFGDKSTIAPNGKLLGSYFLFSNKMNSEKLIELGFVQDDGSLFPHHSFVSLKFILEKLSYPLRMLELAEKINKGPFVWIPTIGLHAVPRYPFWLGPQFFLRDSLNQSWNQEALRLTAELPLFNFDITSTDFFHNIKQDSNMEEKFTRFFGLDLPLHLGPNLPLHIILEFRKELLNSP